MFLLRSLLIFVCSLSLAGITRAQIKIDAKSVEAILYLGANDQQPLIVGLGGSEGGNAWTSDYWKPVRDRFIDKGYAFLALGYFGAPGTPAILDRISIDLVHEAIISAAKNKKINSKKIAIIGGSRGGDLALLLGSYYSDIDCVITIVASSAVFPGHTNHFNTSCWTYNEKELAYIPVNDEAVPFLKARNFRATFETMMKDSVAYEKAAIPVERINGPVLFISATKDEICPSTPMAEKMMQRMKEKNFKSAYKHVPIEGGHSAPLKHMDLVFDFLSVHFTAM